MQLKGIPGVSIKDALSYYWASPAKGYQAAGVLYPSASVSEMSMPCTCSAGIRAATSPINKAPPSK